VKLRELPAAEATKPGSGEHDSNLPHFAGPLTRLPAASGRRVVATATRAVW
jgi:hypothetical protein